MIRQFVEKLFPRNKYGWSIWHRYVSLGTESVNQEALYRHNINATREIRTREMLPRTGFPKGRNFCWCYPDGETGNQTKYALGTLGFLGLVKRTNQRPRGLKRTVQTSMPDILKTFCQASFDIRGKKSLHKFWHCRGGANRVSLMARAAVSPCGGLAAFLLRRQGRLSELLRRGTERGPHSCTRLGSLHPPQQFIEFAVHRFGDFDRLFAPPLADLGGGTSF